MTNLREQKDRADVQAPASGAPGSPWLQVDGAAAYMGGVSRKTVYAAVAAGMRVTRLGGDEPHRDSRGRVCQGRILFSTVWIDEFLERRSTCAPLRERTVDAKSLSEQQESGPVDVAIATDVQRTAEFPSREAVPCAR